jgi:hypothetical protein
MAPATVAATLNLNLGFLTILNDASGYVGGYLVTNVWARPLEFRLSSAVQPNRLQQILYGGTLQPYVCADLIGKTLVDKTTTSVQLVLTDREPVLELRWSLEVPVVWLAQPGDPVAAVWSGNGAEVRPGSDRRGPVFCHPRFPGDAMSVREKLDRLDGHIDFDEPFARIRDAIAEARKMGGSGRG